MANDVTFDGGAIFLSKWAGVPPQKASHGSRGAVYAEGESTLAFGGPVMFRNNSAATGGAVTLADLHRSGGAGRPRMTFTTSKSSSFWVGNYAFKSSGGAALRIEPGCRAEFGTVATHNCGSNIAGALSSRVQNDVVVWWQGSYTCGGKTRGVGSYKVEGNLCAPRCFTQVSCKCPLGQVFRDLKCSCQ
jgi:hypothetical protein